MGYRSTEPASPVTVVSEEEVEYIHGDIDVEDNIDDNVNDISSFAAEKRNQTKNQKPKSFKEKIKHNFTVVAAVSMGVIVAIVKFIAAGLTGSSAMFSEGIHSLVDAANDSLLLIGTKVSKKKPDVLHPFGYGKLLYFYTFVVSLAIFVFGGGLAFLEGLRSFVEGGNVVENPIIDYVVLGIGIILEGFSLSVAIRDVNRSRGDMGVWQYIKNSKSPTNFTVLLEDSAAVSGMIIAIAGIALSRALSIPQIDSVASMVIGLIMAIVAIILLLETRSLLIGEGLLPDDIEEIEYIVEEDPAIIKCGRILTMYMSPDDLIVTIDATFDDELDEGDVLQAVDRIEAQIADEYPQCSSIFIEAESLNQVYRQRYDRKIAMQEYDDDDNDEEEDSNRYSFLQKKWI